MTALTVEVITNPIDMQILQDPPLELVEVLHPGPRGLNALDLNHIDGGAAATVYGSTSYDVVDGGGA